MDTSKPIGYWLRHLHGLLEEQLGAVLADQALTRRQWQALNTLSLGECTHDDLVQALGPFWEEGEPDLDEVIGGSGGLAARGWVRPGEAPGTLALTAAGRAAHARAAARIDQSRAVVMKGLTPQQYAQTVRTLAAMAGNVEAALSARPV